jgi:hypothetical protein
VLAPALLLFVASAEADSETIAAAVQGASQALGAEARVALSPYAGKPPGDAELAAVGRAGQATVVARLVWSDPARTRATLDAYLLHSDQAVHREFRFQPQDRPSERGRAIGLVLASLAMADRTAPTEPDPRAQELNLASERGPPASETAAVRWALEAFAGGGVALGSAGSGLGGGLGGRVQGQSPWGARLGLHVRAGSLAVAQASSLGVAGSAGGWRRFLPVDPDRPWQLCLRGDLLLMYEALTHFSDDDPEPVRRGRFLPGAAALLEGEWRISSSAALHLATGLEAAFGVTRVLVRGNQVATLAPIRGVLEMGLRARF